ncbi:MAG: hypothetical protein V4622_12580 [Bacteroidota bacterium]
MKKQLLFLFIFLTFCVYSQKEKPSLQQFQKTYSYQKSKKYKGPENTNYESPAEMDDENSESKTNTSSGNKGTINYSPQQIQKQRSNKNYYRNENNRKKGYGEGGNKASDPEMGKPQPIEFDTPEMETDDVDLPDFDPSVSMKFWKILLIIILAIVVFFVAYYIIKNYKPKNKKIISPITQDDWNPDLISKSELELRLEEAMKRGDYRECVRIYFTFILKEMIRLNRIRWKKELTNYDYVLQAKSQKNAFDFEESVRIYDLVWYGEYQINQGEYSQLQAHLNKNFKDLENA